MFEAEADISFIRFLDNLFRRASAVRPLTCFTEAARLETLLDWTTH